MSIGTALAILRLLLSLASFFARRAERNDIAEAIGAQLEASHGKRVDKAADARDDVLAGRVLVDVDGDVNNRDREADRG